MLCKLLRVASINAPDLSPLLLLMRQGNLREQLQIDHQAQPPFQLKKRRRLPPRQYLVHHRHILQPQRLRLRVRLHRAPHINQRILIRHRCPRFRVLLEQGILRVVHFMQIVRVVFVNGPELLRFRIRQRHIFPNHLHFHCPYIFPQQRNVRVRHCRAHDTLHGNLLPLRLRPHRSHSSAQRSCHHHPRNKRRSQSRRSRHFAFHNPSPWASAPHSPPAPPISSNPILYEATSGVKTVHLQELSWSPKRGGPFFAPLSISGGRRLCSRDHI